MRSIDAIRIAGGCVLAGGALALLAGLPQGLAAPAATQSVAARPVATQPADPFVGLFKLSDYKASDSGPRTGSVRIERRGELYVLGARYSDDETWQGVAARVGDCIVAAIGAPPAVSLTDYRRQPDGSLIGAVVPLFAPGGDKKLIGYEKLTAQEAPPNAAELASNYRIADSRAPRSGVVHQGSVTVAASGGATLGGEYAVHGVTWILQEKGMEEARLPGLGVRIGERFLVASSPAKRFGVVLFKPGPSGTLLAEFQVNNGAAGSFTLSAGK
jgi:hypothetical protein